VKTKKQKIQKAEDENERVSNLKTETKNMKVKAGGPRRMAKGSSGVRKESVTVFGDLFGTINVPKDRAVPFGAITPAPVKQQELFMTSNWRIVRPVIDHEKCTRCFTCYIVCPDSCWSFNEQEEKMEWNWKFCKGCQICINECPADALSAVPELDFEDGVVRLEKPF
jgi:2-oxoacid:acceptor oxidoreductase delta subunit (pyruvate/2-ketoisovalerate family)